MLPTGFYLFRSGALEQTNSDDGDYIPDSDSGSYDPSVTFSLKEDVHLGSENRPKAECVHCAAGHVPHSVLDTESP